MKIKCLIILFYLISFTSNAIASECLISSLLINNQDEREIDIVMDKDKMYLPCKYILSFFNVSYKENHVDKSLSFKNVTLKKGSCLVNSIKQPYAVFFIKTTSTGNQNEFFISAEALSKFLQKDIASDSHQLLAFITDKTLMPNEKEQEKEGNPFAQYKEQKPQAYEEITLPVQKGWISLDSVGVKNNITSDSYSQIYKDNQSKSCTFNSNAQYTLSGRLNSGEYKLGFGTNSYTQNPFAFSGISPQYKNRYKNFGKDFDYLIGKADAWKAGDTSISMDIMGLQLKDHIDESKTYNDIEGNVNPTSTVKVYINNDFEKELSTYGGYYSLKNLYYSGGEVKKIRIEELLADGTSKEILNKNFTKNNKNNIPKRDFILGVTGLQNRLWANNGIIYQETTKKLVGGF